MEKKEKKTQEPKPVKLTAIDQDILTVLLRAEERYGLEILECLNLDREKILGIELGFGSLYPALNRLEKKGLIEWRWGNEDEVSGGARRKYYKITGLGERSLKAINDYRSGLMGLAFKLIGLWGV